MSNIPASASIERFEQDDKLWEVLDRLRGDDEYDPPYPSDLVRAVAQETGMSSATVRRTVDHPEVWSATIDYVAVERCVELDLSPLPYLTVRERLYVARELFLHPDPWGVQGKTYVGSPGVKQARGAVGLPITQRAVRWAEMGHSKQESLRYLVSHFGDGELARYVHDVR